MSSNYQDLLSNLRINLTDMKKIRAQTLSVVDGVITEMESQSTDVSISKTVGAGAAIVGGVLGVVSGPIGWIGLAIAGLGAATSIGTNITDVVLTNNKAERLEAALKFDQVQAQAVANTLEKIAEFQEKLISGLKTLAINKGVGDIFTDSSTALQSFFSNFSRTLFKATGMEAAGTLAKGLKFLPFLSIPFDIYEIASVWTQKNESLERFKDLRKKLWDDEQTISSLAINVDKLCIERLKCSKISGFQVDLYDSTSRTLLKTEMIGSRSSVSALFLDGYTDDGYVYVRAFLDEGFQAGKGVCALYLRINGGAPTNLVGMGSLADKISNSSVSGTEITTFTGGSKFYALFSDSEPLLPVAGFGFNQKVVYGVAHSATESFKICSIDSWVKDVRASCTFKVYLAVLSDEILSVQVGTSEKELKTSLRVLETYNQGVPVSTVSLFKGDSDSVSRWKPDYHPRLLKNSFSSKVSTKAKDGTTIPDFNFLLSFSVFSKMHDQVEVSTPIEPSKSCTIIARKLQLDDIPFTAKIKRTYMGETMTKEFEGYGYVNASVDHIEVKYE